MNEKLEGLVGGAGGELGGRIRRAGGLGARLARRAWVGPEVVHKVVHDFPESKTAGDVMSVNRPS